MPRSPMLALIGGLSPANGDMYGEPLRLTRA
jgi:hypothetical protein